MILVSLYGRAARAREVLVDFIFYSSALSEFIESFVPYLGRTQKLLYFTYSWIKSFFLKYSASRSLFLIDVELSRIMERASRAPLRPTLFLIIYHMVLATYYGAYLLYAICSALRARPSLLLFILNYIPHGSSYLLYVARSLHFHFFTTFTSFLRFKKNLKLL